MTREKNNIHLPMPFRAGNESTVLALLSIALLLSIVFITADGPQALSRYGTALSAVLTTVLFFTRSKRTMNASLVGALHFHLLELTFVLIYFSTKALLLAAFFVLLRWNIFYVQLVKQVGSEARSRLFAELGLKKQEAPIYPPIYYLTAFFACFFAILSFAGNWLFSGLTGQLAWIPSTIVVFALCLMLPSLNGQGAQE